jgi:C1A family cysteine protease
MRILVAIVLLGMVALAAASLPPLKDEQYEMLFTSWARQHGKSYESHEFLHRFMVWKRNLDHVRTHNAKNEKSYTLAMNVYGDLTNEEFMGKYAGYRPIDNMFLKSNNFGNFSVKGIPASVDWRVQNKVTPVKDQGQCGSCWAFSATGSIEAAYAIENNVDPVSISEQQLVDCSTAQGNQGCNGGLMDQAFQYVISNPGLCAESAYPYKAVDGTCVSSSCSCVVKIGAFSDVPPNDQNVLAAAVAQQPVSVAVDASGADWQLYSSGIMNDCVFTALDHGVLAVGYGTDSASNQDYWIVKNSWGLGWGESGYVRLLRNGNSGSVGECGITQASSYPTGATAC